MDHINMDVTDIFRQTVFKVANKNINLDFASKESYPTPNEFFEELSKHVSTCFSLEIQQAFYTALLDEYQKSNL